MRRNQYDASNPVGGSASSTSEGGSWTRMQFERSRHPGNVPQTSYEMSSMEDVTTEDIHMKDVTTEDIHMEDLSTGDTKKRKRDNNGSPQRDTKMLETEEKRKTVKEEDDAREREDQQYAWNRFENRYNYYKLEKKYDHEKAFEDALDWVGNDDRELVIRHLRAQQPTEEGGGPS